MSYPTIDLNAKKVILLSGFVRPRRANKPLTVRDKKKLEAAAKKHRDAVAFGYVAGKWMPAA